MNESELNQNVDELASQCVKCALCLPHCPTYLLTQDENESPRGRIALFQALSKQQLPLSEKAQEHLDQCLGCRACERVCPAHVQYGRLLTEGRAMLKTLPTKDTRRKAPISVRFLGKIATQPVSMKIFHFLLWLTQVSGLRQFSQKMGFTRMLGLQNLDQLMPKIAKPKTIKDVYPVPTPKGAISLFTGCISHLADQETLEASIFVLNKLGYEVHVPKNQNCCGAMALHAGDLKTAQELAQENLHAFKSTYPIITTATGCCAVLQEYNSHFSLESHLNFQDLLSFILQSEWPADLKINPLPMKIMIHTPCTRRNVLKSPESPERLLSKIPECTWHTFKSPHCCGAAGTYMIEHPKLASALATQLLQECQSVSVDVIATTNIGCALHLKRTLKTTNPNIQLCHPILLIAKALGFSDSP